MPAEVTAPRDSERSRLRLLGGIRAVGRAAASPGTTLSLLALTVLAFLQRPGEVTFDTKLDLAANPIDFLGRALHLWNPEATSGELQNQAYGYLFPMGPFFAVGQLLDVPPWITQRVWCAALLCGAFLGVLLLARVLHIGSEPTRCAAALGYALAPRMLTEIGLLSAEMLAVALLPWVLLPLAAVRRLGSPRRAAALSALAVLCMSGVNAALVVTALVLPGLWLLTRRWDRAHLRLVAWWCVAVVGVTLWWIVPLLLLGQYSPPFLDFIESSTTTTGVASLFQAVRGTNQWVAFVVQGEPWWPAGWLLVDNPILMALTALVAAVGLAGFACRGLPERQFLVLGFLAGLALMTIGYVGSLDSPLSGSARELLDGPLAPLRNVHKFEPVLRLPIMLGLAHAVAVGVGLFRHSSLISRWCAGWLSRLSPLRLGGLRRVTDSDVPRQWLAVVPVLLLIAGAAAPAWLGQLRLGPGWTDLPAHWRQAASWLAAHDPAARTLVVPASGFGQYTWGRTVDEPIQALAEAPWALRHQVPLGSAGNTRVMDTVEAVLAQGRGSPSLADFLARAGYRHLLVRHDIDRTQVEAPPVAVLRRALANSPGLVPVASFGPAVRMDDQQSSPVDAGARPVPAIEVYEVQRPVPPATAVLTGDVATVSGGPESLLPLLEQGLLERDRPTVLAGDRPRQGANQWIVTDGLRRRERNVGRVRDNLSQTLTADEAARQRRVALDVVPFPGAEHQTVAAYQGIRTVTASTAASFADNFVAAEPSYLPFAAIDGDPATAWRSAPLTGPVGQWLEVALDTPRQVNEVRLAFVNDLGVGWPVTRFLITTDQGSVEHEVAPSSGNHAYSTLPGVTTKVRVTVLGVAGGRTNGGLGIGELSVPDMAPRRALRVPADVPNYAGPPPAYSFSRGPATRAACVADVGSNAYDGGVVPDASRAAAPVRCDRFLARVGEEPLGIDRLFRTPTAASYQVHLTAVARPGGQVPLAGSAQAARVSASASSNLAGDPAVAAYAAVDSDPTTAWVAETTDPRPTLSLSWSTPRRIGELRIRAADEPVASVPRVVELSTPRGSQVVRLGSDGLARFTPVRTDRIEISVRDVDLRVADRRGGWPAPAGIAEIEVPALADLIRPVPPQTPISVACGAGPAVEIDGVRYDTSVAGTLADITAGRALPVTLCDGIAADGVDLPHGEHRLRTTRSESFVAQDAWLTPKGATRAAPRHRDVQVVDWAATDRTVRVGAGGEALLVVPENMNAGWRATLNGRVLPTTRVDGWQQAWVVPAGETAEVRLTFVPDTAYRGGLTAGALTALAVVCLAVWPVRRRPPVGPPGGQATGWWIAAALIGLIVALGGVLAMVIVIAAMLLRQFLPRALPAITLAAMAAATAGAVAGRVLGHGQGWAYGPWVQAAMLVAVGAVVASAIPVPGRREADSKISTVIAQDEDGTMPV
ncbi:alpha-(1-_3)-arabinofuranosyltransferase domain-containing protein [Micromonospora sp. DT47]|uniref:alpha-(1->3)-arabinofuranosyltransferase domain-containing protein n=1 Tax=Micromonospora sp. DT47 TaxID=3393431 RepID=UPI003CF591F9